jgi:hypothetical protein
MGDSGWGDDKRHGHENRFDESSNIHVMNVKNTAFKVYKYKRQTYIALLDIHHRENGRHGHC